MVSEVVAFLLGAGAYAAGDWLLWLKTKRDIEEGRK